MNRELLVAQLESADGPSTMRDRILDLVGSHDDILERSCRPGHLTGSALVVERETGRVLLLLHTKLGLWLQPGGHADGDPDLAAVALREAQEETGIDGLEAVAPAIDLDVHEVDPPGEDAHLHLDVRYLVLAPRGAALAPNHESRDIRWVERAELPTYGVDAGLIRMADAGLAVAERLGEVG